MKEQIHATCIAMAETGVLLIGPSGSGKSDLALRLIDAGALLIADDRVDLNNESGVLIARAPEALFGLIEVRGLGIIDRPAGRESPVGLAIELTSSEPERLPDPLEKTLAGVRLPLFRLDPFEISVAQKVALAVGLTTGDIRRAHD